MFVSVRLRAGIKKGAEAPLRLLTKKEKAWFFLLCG